MCWWKKAKAPPAGSEAIPDDALERRMFAVNLGLDQLVAGK